MSGSLATCWIAVEIHVATDAAILVCAGVESKAWIPKSQVMDSEEELVAGTSQEIEIPEWLATEKGLI